MCDNKVLAGLTADPRQFVKLLWPATRLSDKQSDVLLSVRDHPETFVHAANKTGKTRVAALAVLWFFTSRTPARVIVSSSGTAQLESILWQEILQLIHTSKERLPLLVHHLRIQKLRAGSATETETRDYVLGHVTTKPENLQGHHLDSDKPRTMVVFDEASGVPDEFFEAAGSWAHRKLVIGNPLHNNSFFYSLCKQGDFPDPANPDRLMRKVIHIGGRDSPNVEIAMRLKEQGIPGPAPVLIPGLLTYEEYVRRERTWDEVRRTTRLEGNFHEGAATMLFPPDVLDRAMDPRRWAQLAEQPRQALAMGVDVAAGGRDNTCWTIVDQLGMIDQFVMDLSNTMEIVGHTIRLIRQFSIAPQNVVFDAGGGGKQLVDRLCEQGFRVQAVHFGSAAYDKANYLNRRAELYGWFRERLRGDGEEETFALKSDPQLRAELAVLPSDYGSEGRLQLPSKNDTSGSVGQKSIRHLLGGRSPDRADSLVLAAAMLPKKGQNPMVENLKKFNQLMAADPPPYPSWEEEFDSMTSWGSNRPNRWRW